MANPEQIVLTTANTWYKVASGVTTGVITIDRVNPHYLFTYRLAGDTAPSGIVVDEKAFEGTQQAVISHSEPIDVYVKCDEDNGSVVVSI